MQSHDDPVEEIQANFTLGNFGRTLQMAEQWMQSIPLDEQRSANYLNAKEAYLYSRFFAHRHERISKLKVGAERARTFLNFLTEIINIQEENNLEGKFWPALKFYMHTQIAEGLAKDFSGQKSFNLDNDEIMQLATSLVEIENWKAAEEALLFVYKANPKNALANFLLAFVNYNKPDDKMFNIYLREALFIKPEIAGGYLRFLPVGVYSDLWKRINHGDISFEIKLRYFALTLEINGIYQYKRKIRVDELKKLEYDFVKIYNEFNKNLQLRDEINPRVLHYLCWIIEAANQLKDFDKVNEYRAIMIQIDKETWSTFQENNLKS